MKYRKLRIGLFVAGYFLILVYVSALAEIYVEGIYSFRTMREIVYWGSSYAMVSFVLGAITSLLCLFGIQAIRGDVRHEHVGEKANS